VEDKSGQITQFLHQLKQGERAHESALIAIVQTFDEIARHHGAATRTVKGDWTTACARLHYQLAPLK
jgi:hypothetical protein